MTPAPPLFDASSSLEVVLAWPGLPSVLRRALTRVGHVEPLTHVTFLESLRSPDPRFREWVVGLLALDIGVELADDRRDDAIGVFSSGTLRTAAMTRFFIPGIGRNQGYGASFRSTATESVPTACAAAYVYVAEAGAIESIFVFVSGAPDQPIAQLQMTAETVESALASVESEDLRAVVREALHECMQTIGHH